MSTCNDVLDWEAPRRERLPSVPNNPGLWRERYRGRPPPPQPEPEPLITTCDDILRWEPPLRERLPSRSYCPPPTAPNPPITTCDDILRWEPPRRERLPSRSYCPELWRERNRARGPPPSRPGHEYDAPYVPPAAPTPPGSRHPSPSRHRSRSRQPSTTSRAEPESVSPVPDERRESSRPARRATSRYPPSASRYSSPVVERQSQIRPRRGRQYGDDDSPAASATGVPDQYDNTVSGELQELRDRVSALGFGRRPSVQSSRRSRSRASSSASSSFSTQPAAASRRPSPAWSDFFDRTGAPDDGGDDAASSSPLSTRRNSIRRGHQQTQATSMLSGFEDQMEVDKHGNERFRPGTEIHDQWSGYTDDKKLANDATRRYFRRKAECPPRKRTLVGPDAALGDENQYKLGRNFTVQEHRELRHLAHDVFSMRKPEAGGRRDFNQSYGKVWEKRALTTGKDSVENHKTQARAKASSADDWLQRSKSHYNALRALGVPEAEITPLSSWGSEGGKWESLTDK